MKINNKIAFGAIALGAAAYLLFRLFYLFWGAYSQLHSNINVIASNPEDVNIIVTYSQSVVWGNLFRFDYLISKVTEVSYILAICFLMLVFIEVIRGKRSKGKIINYAKNMGLWLFIGAGYKFLIWPAIETIVRSLDKVNIPFSTSDPLLMLAGIGVYIAAKNADEFRAALEEIL